MLDIFVLTFKQLKSIKENDQENSRDEFVEIMYFFAIDLFISQVIFFHLKCGKKKFK